MLAVRNLLLIAALAFTGFATTDPLYALQDGVVTCNKTGLTISVDMGREAISVVTNTTHEYFRNFTLVQFVSSVMAELPSGESRGRYFNNNWSMSPYSPDPDSDVHAYVGLMDNDPSCIDPIQPDFSVLSQSFDRMMANCTADSGRAYQGYLREGCVFLALVMSHGIPKFLPPNRDLVNSGSEVWFRRTPYPKGPYDHEAFCICHVEGVEGYENEFSANVGDACPDRIYDDENYNRNFLIPTSRKTKVDTNSQWPAITSSE